MSINYPAIEQALRVRATELLDAGEICEVIGWESGRFANQTTPVFIHNSADTSRLVYSAYCVNTLGKYARNERVLVRNLATGENIGKKIAVCVRGCDSRGINRMIADNQLEREDVYLLGLPCAGVLDRSTDLPYNKCAACSHRDALGADEVIGAGAGGVADVGGANASAGSSTTAATAAAAAAGAGTAATTEAGTGTAATTEAGTAAAAATAGASAAAGTTEAGTAPDAQALRFSAVQKFEAMPAAARLDFFAAAFNKCIRCYACRQVCPVCTCNECFTDRDNVGWQGKQSNLAENRFYGLTRVFHIADRCVECGECERSCPMELPLMLLNRKMIKDLADLFAMQEGGLTTIAATTLCSYDVNDREEIM
jgi:ferredoxin